MAAHPPQCDTVCSPCGCVRTAVRRAYVRALVEAQRTGAVSTVSSHSAERGRVLDLAGTSPTRRSRRWWCVRRRPKTSSQRSAKSPRTCGSRWRDMQRCNMPPNDHGNCGSAELRLCTEGNGARRTIVHTAPQRCLLTHSGHSQWRLSVENSLKLTSAMSRRGTDLTADHCAP